MLRFKYLKLKIQSNCINEKHTNTGKKDFLTKKLTLTVVMMVKSFLHFPSFYFLVNFLQRMYIPLFIGKY